MTPKPRTINRPLPPRPPAPAPVQKSAVSFSAPMACPGHRIVLYGPGGIGKTTLAAGMEGKTVFFDLDESLCRLRGMDHIPCAPCGDWQAILTALQSTGWDDVQNIVLDSATRAEELAIVHTLAHTLQDGKRSSSVEGYGYGKGYGYVFDTFLPILGELDRHAREGRNVVLICHDCTTNVPNPAGEDWLRYEPRLQSPTSGKASIRLRVREWADHVLFLGYDVAVDKDGKGQGSGTRTLYPVELPHCMAKSRTMREPVEVTDNNADQLWSAILGKE